MLPIVRERSTHSSTTKTVLASQYSDSALVSVQPVSESANYCPVSTSSMSTSRFQSRPPSRFRNRPPNQFRSGPLPCTGYETGWVVNQALTYTNQQKFSSRVPISLYLHVIQLTHITTEYCLYSIKHFSSNLIYIRF